MLHILSEICVEGGELLRYGNRSMARTWSPATCGAAHARHITRMWVAKPIRMENIEEYVRRIGCSDPLADNANIVLVFL